MKAEPHNAQDRPQAAAMPAPAAGQGRFGGKEGQPPDFHRSELHALELENSDLRRLVVELLEKNQKLRERLQAATSDWGAQTCLASSSAAS